MRGGIARLGVALAILAVVPSAGQAADFEGEPSVIGGLRVPARASSSAVELSLGGGDFAPRFWAGVNLGATTPGHDPGELAVKKAEYARWFDEMGALGVRVVRVYTLMRPHFYSALAAYNETHRRTPIRLLQGIYLDEDRLHAIDNAYDPAFMAEIDTLIRETVAAVHGAGDVPPRPGLASGRYRTSVAPWLLGWSFGVEWDPQATAGTDEANAGVARFKGTYFQATDDATPMESWLAQRLDVLATAEAAQGWSTPLTFTNWVTADPLRHPAEPLRDEDLVSIDALHVRPTAAWPAGSYASYHVYPYYPDFLSLGAEPYGGYLAALRAHHAAGGQAVMITEFGVPSSYGIAHTAPLGRDQGAHSEKEAGRIDAAMLREIAGAGMAGGLLFEWIDEWFKRAWNTQDLEQPIDRRRLWRNSLTNEEHFGVLAAEPVTPPLRQRGGGIRAAIDPEALTVALSKAPGKFVIGVDARPGDGGGLPGSGAAPSADVAFIVDGKRATVEQAGFWEPTGAQWAASDGIAPAAPWQPARMLISHPLTRPDTGEQIPARTELLGPLAVTRRDGEATIRLPWQLLGFADPSTRLIFGVAGEAVSFLEVPGVQVFAVEGSRTRESRLISWPAWNRVRWEERRKASWSILRRAFAATTR